MECLKQIILKLSESINDRTSKMEMCVMKDAYAISYHNISYAL